MRDDFSFENNTLKNREDYNKTKIRHTLSIIDIVGKIEQYSMAEDKGTDLDERIFTTRDKIDYTMAGFSWFFIGVVAFVLITPFSMAVLSEYIPVFNDKVPTLFDKVFVVLFTLALTMLFLIMVIGLPKYIKGKVTLSMVKHLLQGATFALISKVIIGIIFYNGIYYTLLSKEKAYNLVLKLVQKGVIKNNIFANKLYFFLVKMGNVMPSSTVFTILSTIVMLGILWGRFYYYKRKIERKEKQED